MGAGQIGCNSLVFIPGGGPPAVVVSVVGCYQDILACGGSSLSSAHQNVGTSLSLKKQSRHEQPTDYGTKTRRKPMPLYRMSGLK